VSIILVLFFVDLLLFYYDLFIFGYASMIVSHYFCCINEIIV